MPKFIPDKGKGFAKTSSGRFVPDTPRRRPPAPKPKKPDGGFLHNLKEAFAPGHGLINKSGRKDAALFAKDLYTVGTSLPGGLYATGKTVSSDLDRATGKGGLINHRGGGDFSFKGSRKLGVEMAKSTLEDIKHPLRHPGYTTLDLLGLASVGAGAGVRVAAGAKAAKAASTASKAVRVGEAAKAAAKRPIPAPRAVTFKGQTVHKPASASPVVRAAQVSLDRLGESFPDTPLIGAASVVKHNIAKTNRFAGDQAKAPHGEFTQAAKQAGMLKRVKVRGKVGGLTREAQAKQHALRVVAEGVSPTERATFHGAQLAKGYKASARKNPEIAALRKNDFEKGHAEQIRLNQDAAKYVAVRDGKPTLRDPKMRAAYDAMGRVSEGREDIMGRLGKLTEETMAARLSKPGRVLKGAEFVTEQQAERRARGLERGAVSIDRDVARTVREANRTSVITPELRAATLEMRRANRQAERLSRQRGSIQGGDVAGLRAVADQEKAHLADLMHGETDINEVAPVGPRADLAARRVKRLGEQYDRVGALLDKYERALAAQHRRVREMGAGARAAERQGAASSAVASARAKQVARLGELEGQIKDLTAIRDQARNEADYIRSRGGSLVGAEDFTGGQIRVKTVPKYKKKGVAAPTPGQGSSGLVNTPQELGSIKHPYTGAAYQAGNIRNDVVRLQNEAGLEAQRYYTLITNHQRLKSLGTPQPTDLKHDIAVRVDQLPDQPTANELRTRLENAHDSAVAEFSHGYEGLRQTIFPDISAEAGAQMGNIPGVVWVDKRLLGGLNERNPLIGATDYKIGRGLLAASDAINNATKLAMLYLKPAYVAPNLLGNVAMNLIQQGVFAPMNLGRAAKLNAGVGLRIANKVDAAMGEGLTSSLHSEAGIASKATHTAASVWGKAVDKYPRRAAFLHEARRHGYGTPEKLTQLFDNPKNASALEQVTKRANDAIIDYADLNRAEQALVRRVVFFYPWVKGATKWSVHFVSEHPVQATVATQLAQKGKADQQAVFGNEVPAWGAGLIPVGGGRTVNPSSISVLSTPADVGTQLAGMFPGFGSPSNDIGGQLTPALSVGRDILNGGDFGETERTARNLPIVRLLGGAPPSKSFPRDDQRTKALLYLLGSGIVPRKTDPASLRASYEAQFRR